MCDIKKIINEELTKSDVKAEVVRVIDSNELKDKISKLIAQELKKSPELQNQVVGITKNVITQLYKTLWTKRSFWQSQLSNKSS
jgi:ATP-dependent Lon protease